MNEEVIAQLKARMPENSGLEMPPKVFTDMDAEIIEYREGNALTVRFPVKERYQNPMGAMQGGMIVAAIDNTFGPLSYLVGPPSVTTHINTTYIRPVTKDQAYIDVLAIVLEVTRHQIHMRAEITNAAGKILAISHSSNYFLKP